MSEDQYFESIGHQQQVRAEGDRHLLKGPIVPEGEIWSLRLLAAKNNMDPNVYPTTERETAEISVCVFLLPCPSDHEEKPPGTWVMLENDIDLYQFQSVKWEGYLEMPEGAQIGAWFRGVERDDMLELNAIFDVVKFESQ